MQQMGRVIARDDSLPQHRSAASLGRDVGEATAKLLRHGLLCQLGPGRKMAKAFPFAAWLRADREVTIAL